MPNTLIKKDVIKDFKKGLTTKDLIEKYGLAKSTINRWLRPIRQNIAHLNYKELTNEHLKLLKKYEQTKLELEIFKNLNCLPSTPRIDKLNAIEKFYSVYPVKTMCRLLDVKVGTFYNHLNRRVKEPEFVKNDKMLKPLVLKVFNDSKQRLGSNKIAQVLRKEGYTISNAKAKQLMNELNIKPNLGKKKKRNPVPVESKNKFLKNRVGKNFTRDNPNEVWVGDVTEVEILSNKFFVCIILDLFSRKIISQLISYRSSQNLVCNTFNAAFEARGEPKELIFHSDRGPQYTSYKYRQLLYSLNLIPSYSKTARPRDNAVAESFFSHFKKEEIHRNDYQTLEELTESVDEYIAYFNDFRPHHHLNGKTPNELETEYRQKKGLTALLSNQSSLGLQIKKTFFLGQMSLKGSKVFV